ncbi:SulP family sulfate permease [Nocardia caishijiensis]|uniref:SulP family sulfate permease n=1 Tax=Nocardia caishijiensis TaxID=184756 RepID=A0ABQ6YHG5_9NOCA|nr:SulP family sulfate permease [Nocardia caishijiensis]
MSIDSTPARRPTALFRSQTVSTLRDPRALRVEILAGMVTALALIPETISFSILAGVGPGVGLFTSIVFALTIAVTGGRPAMVSAAAGSVALVVAPLVREHGPDYLIATVLLAGVLQVVLASCGAAALARFIPRAVMTGFVNALAILIFAAQLPHLIDVPWPVYVLVTVGLLIMVVLPRFTGVVPAPLVATIMVTVIAVVFAIDVPRVEDEGDPDAGVMGPALPAVELSWQTLGIIAPYAVGVALVGLLETLLTAQLVDELTGTSSNHRRESWGQGAANIATGLFGGMGGCAMIGQTMMNVKTCHARTRISVFAAGVVLLCLVTVLDQVLAAIPMAALVAVMIAVSATTMDWESLRPATFGRLPVGESVAMVGTVAVTLLTRNLALGVVVGVLWTMLVLGYRRIRERGSRVRLPAPS